MKILAVGDVVGKGGTEYIRRNLWNIRKEYGVTMTVLNGENAASGNGLDADTASVLLASGADVITSGNHIWRKHGISSYMEDNPCVLRPANYPAACPGAGSVIYNTADGVRVLVISLLGNVYMPDSYANPFETADAILARNAGEYDLCVIDFHAEATSEKAALARYLDGRVSVVFGTHTHVQTSDARILPAGTGFITDVGMTGAEESILGVKTECVLRKFLTKMPVHFEEAAGAVRFSAVCFTLDDRSGACTAAETVSRL